MAPKLTDSEGYYIAASAGNLHAMILTRTEDLHIPKSAVECAPGEAKLGQSYSWAEDNSSPLPFGTESQSVPTLTCLRDPV